MSQVSAGTSNNSFHFPLISDKGLAEEKLKDFILIYNESYPDDLKKILENEQQKNLLLSIFSNSPYLTSLFFKYSDFSIRLFKKTPDDLIEEIYSELKEKQFLNQNELTHSLRIAKAKTALTIAFADLSGHWPLDKITRTLSTFAELCLNLSVNFMIREAIDNGDLSHNIKDNVSSNSGYVILAMGKLGGYELNYSSDIDLIVLYDLDIVKYTGRKSIQDFFIRMTQRLVKIMSERTADGYVFRTDLRLRPDPGATPVALSMEGAEFYYQSVGLNWERAAMIKARPIAGDISAGLAFLERIRGFVWRKHLDYAAIDDIHAIKKLIHEHHSHTRIKLEGHDVKLGPGGIREIEFIAQIHQLIAGGREPALRIAPTLPALEALCKSGKVDTAEYEILKDAYIYLRTLEHRLQMVNDDQTHIMPTSNSDIERMSKFMGYVDRAKFEKDLINHLNCVQDIFNGLLQDTNQTQAEDISLSFPLDEFHPTTLKAIEEAGFSDSKKIYTIIQNWQLGRYRACRTERARTILKQLVPDILKIFGQHKDPDSGIIKFDEFLSRLPSGVQLFSFIKAQPWLLDLLAQITGIAPFLANQLAKRPLLLDSVLNAENFKKNSSLKKLQDNLDEQLRTALDFQDVLDITRKWTNEGKFQVGLQILRGDTDVIEFSKTLSNIAQTSLKTMLKYVEREFAKKHGIIKNSSICVLAMGKFGGFEMSTTSDIDMVLIYEANDMESYSDGSKPFSVNHYYARLCQNFITSITALTAEGKLYEVDMRLRPSGTAGPLAVSFESFKDYQSGQAWTWEHMALTRGRVIAGPKPLQKKIEEAILNTLSNKNRDPGKLLLDVANMRKKLVDNFATSNIWAMKHIRGGIIDVEFICQYLLLRHGADHPEILKKNTLEQITALSKANILEKEIANELYKASHILSAIQAMLRLCLDNENVDQEKPYALLLTLAERFNTEPDKVEALILENQNFIHNLYYEIIETPASEMLIDEPSTNLNNK
ncbi:MAG: bifunctional [glutamine synthetase] adenylyltransferase/[glutamine synthetase]-adenylyl-L-tyrosine phosphorylase [Alphaproteobacteria bacterium]|nr:bifunctional [glutamine synthetase] adenylyltransferase/[glutamine synthetase]-adenylyl-L-tyrosine phosphorylase [Alphaproteobacteria bacterium]HPF46681.1 bifunctional [glutamine synthetase] adenylyltransferase/[glutamine synthetase]-adenylyl-L-tyrosine phosphorylase [Emcibacteraceae bacterium]HRW28794.1 bifunctional [glutamine synthetase] adenylyltransferase/[glutamine synthetase]-adenylyl-L-tyrosine phosphorylase [Emcibacteraceae bacterium]